MKKMTKIVPVLMCGAILASMAAGCGVSTSFSTSNTETYNGISKTVTESTVNGKSEEKVEYTDENGTVLDQKEGEAAFLAAKEEVEGPAKQHHAAKKADTKTDSKKDNEPIKAYVAIKNDTDEDFTELHAAMEDGEYSDNLFADDFVLTPGVKTDDSLWVKYGEGAEFKFAFVNKDGETVEFEHVTFTNLENPESATLTISGTTGAHDLNVK